MKDIILNAQFVEFVSALKRQCKKELDHIVVPPEVREVANKLKEKNHEVFVVGGQVRDWLSANEQLRSTVEWCSQTIKQWRKLQKKTS